ncbi:facilitated trehalose transporter Tret1-like [Battus philenor]|uniref:facilitated trehalose transporter Tret1-like n=1 Tax=Battus philenor TaxID=42288 RepID=UPI0035D055EB
MKAETLRRYFVYTGLALCSISEGFIYGQMSGMVDALRGKDGEMSLTDENVSWIASTINATCIFGLLVAGVVTKRVGRRLAITYLSLPLLATWIMIYYTTDFVIFLVSRIIVGLSYGGVILLIYTAMAEYTTPTYRAAFMNLVSAVGPSIGTLLGHMLCILLHWRTVALIGFVITGLSALLPVLWIETPSWLASKGRFDECVQAYRKLHGRDGATEAELNLLVNLEQRKRRDFAQNKIFISSDLYKIRMVLKQRYFLKIIGISLVMCLYRMAGGRTLYNTLAITMLQEMTGSSNILLFTMLIDGFIILGSILPIFIFMKMKLRTVLFSSGLTCNIVLISLSICLYCLPKQNIYFGWICASLLAFYFIIAYAGPYAVLEILLTEIYPSEIKVHCVLTFGSCAGILQFFNIKLASRMFDLMGYHGVFLLNSVIVFLCLLYFWFYLPETNGRTLQEIELFFKNGKFPSQNDVLKIEQSECLVRSNECNK